MGDRAASILLVDDHAIIAEPLKIALAVHGFDRVHAVDTEDQSLEAVLATAQGVGAEIVLLDLHLGAGAVGVPMIGPLIETGAKVVLFTSRTDPRLVAAGLRAGAKAVIDKAMAFQHLIAVLIDVAAGRELIPEDEREALIQALEIQYRAEDERLAPFHALTQREAHVLRRLIEGDAPKEIARAEGISISTVRGHIERIFGKLGVSSQRQALVLARSAGWPPDGKRQP